MNVSYCYYENLFESLELDVNFQNVDVEGFYRIDFSLLRLFLW